MRPGEGRQQVQFDRSNPFGNRVARSLAWFVDREQSTEALHRLIGRTRAGDVIPRRWVPEPFITGTRWGGDSAPFWYLQNVFLPLMADGLVESRSATRGQVMYRIKQKPKSIDQVLDDAVGWVVEFDESYADQCLDHLAECREQIVQDKKRYDDIGPIPLCMTDGKCRRDYVSISGIEILFPRFN